MNSDTVTFKVDTSWSFRSRDHNFLNTIVLDLKEIFKEVIIDENGMVTRNDSYSNPQVSQIQLQPSHFSPYFISQFLRESIEDTEFCDILSHRIVNDPASLLPGPFMLSLNIEVTRECQIMRPTISIPLGASSDDKLHKVMEEMRIGSMDFKKEEEELTCSICLENLSESTSENHADVVMLANCQHMFHEECVFEWIKLNNSCPLCRREVFEEEDED